MPANAELATFAAIVRRSRRHRRRRRRRRRPPCAARTGRVDGDAVGIMANMPTMPRHHPRLCPTCGVAAGLTPRLTHPHGLPTKKEIATAYQQKKRVMG